MYQGVESSRQTIRSSVAISDAVVTSLRKIRQVEVACRSTSFQAGHFTRRPGVGVRPFDRLTARRDGRLVDGLIEKDRVPLFEIGCGCRAHCNAPEAEPGFRSGTADGRPGHETRGARGERDADPMRMFVDIVDRIRAARCNSRQGRSPPRRKSEDEFFDVGSIDCSFRRRQTVATMKSRLNGKIVFPSACFG